MYEIAEYDKRYRPYDKSGGELKTADWVKLPAKPKGDGLEALLEYKRGLEYFAIWCLLLEKSTAEKKPENRGKLLNHKEEPASVQEIAKAISLKNKTQLTEEAISALVALGWVLCNGEPEAERNKFPLTSVKSRVEKSRVEKSRVEKSRHLDFIFLSKDEYKKLIDKFGKKLTYEKIVNLNNAIGSKGYKYKSHYHTILSWDRRTTKGDNGKTKLFPIKGRICEIKNCRMPAVYKTSEDYDHYYCLDHSPEKVKEKYC